ncbi:hypothetical protein LPTSP3_g11130 [Leptospira kobayashii]|uniref:Uncharacterized protein n=1 Tax=Leptospira kobayashii TaxID=1917830 RepID=A0ABN6KEZ0_9LEPT|nr:hypothetical protein [Leptospira kobayashii]BDA78183.1 hypothetical protein LPTSP3_g11130 [Leptospira kobayashii]
MEQPFKPKPLLNKSELRQIKRSRTRVEGKKVLTDDVRKLKSLKVTPDLSPTEAIHYYKEPIWIEYYIPKESRFAYETKFLFILLVDPKPNEEESDIALKEAIEKKTIIDVWNYIRENREHADFIKGSYHSTISMHETISHIFNTYHETKNTEELKTACYLTEALLKYEPTLASLRFFRDYVIFNLNYFIRELNKAKIEFSLEDATVSLLIKRRNELWEEENRAEDEDFDLLAALFFEQAFPNRGASELSTDDLRLVE